MELKENAKFGEQGKYRLIDPLGRGGYSVVWLAEDTLTEINVALKIFAPGTGLDNDGIDIFKEEFKLVFNLKHSNILCPTSFGIFEGMPYLVMSYYERGSSSKLAGNIDEATIWKFLYDVAAGLTYLHDLDPPVIHQDIKPDNILMDRNHGKTTFLITDFGISTKAQNTLRQSMPTANSAEAGTTAYMAPERFAMGYRPIKATDIWSLGASLVELMTGNPPFAENGGHFQGKDTKISDIEGNWSDELNHWVKQCLHFNTWERPTAKKLMEVADKHIHPDPQRKTTESSIKWILALAGMLIFGFLTGFLTGRSMNRPDPTVYECIQLIEQGEAVFDEGNLKTWRESFGRYQQANDLIEQHDLPLPNMEIRIKQLKGKMDAAIKRSIDRAKEAFAMGSKMALVILEEEALVLDPDHKEAKALHEQYSNFFNSNQ